MSPMLTVISMLVIVGCYVGLCDSHPESSLDLPSQMEEENEESDRRADLIYSSYQNFMAERESLGHPRYARDAPDYPREHKRRRRNNSGSNMQGRDAEVTRDDRTILPRVEDDPEDNVKDGNSSNHPYPWPKGCEPCKYREDRKRLRLEMIKIDILRKLKMTAPPNITNIRNLPPDIFPVTKTNDTQNFSHDQPTPDPEDNEIVQIFTFSEPLPEEKYTEGQYRQDPKVIYFKLESDILNSRLHSAKLYVYVKKGRSKGNVKISMMERKQGKITRSHTLWVRQIFEQGDRTWENGAWLEINVTNIVEKWIQGMGGSVENLGLQINAKDKQSSSIAVITPESEAEERYKPFLQCEIATGKSRPRRGMYDMSRDCEDFSPERECCRYNLEVKFADFGWDWIIQPRYYSAFFCAGECNLAFYPNTHHSHIVSLSRDENQLGGPCCTPVRTSPVSLIYFDHNNRIIYHELDDMVADRCGCN